MIFFPFKESLDAPVDVFLYTHGGKNQPTEELLNASVVVDGNKTRRSFLRK